MARRALLILGACMLISASASAQTYGTQLDRYFGDWHTAATRTVNGHLSEQEILTRGDALHPSSNGAVLRFTSAYEYATLAPHAETSAIRLEGQQQIYFVVSGEGKAVAGSQSVVLSSNIAVLIPSGLEFKVMNTGTEPLAMYVIQEPAPAGFHANTSMLARDENSLPFSTTDLQWSYMVKKIFVASDGLATLTDVSTVYLDPLTVSRPQSTDSPDSEAIWTALQGTGIAFVSNRLLRQPPGMAFMDVPDGKTPHSIINPNQDSQIKFLYFAHKPASVTNTHRPN
jgi:mannose-6-phosphate isomerase-like protein (cupin superfamily)